MDGTMRILEKRFAQYLLIRICQQPGQTKTYYATLDPKNVMTKNDRMKELEQAGLIRVDQTDRINNKKLVYPTDRGMKVGKILVELHDALEYIECREEEY